MPTKNKFTFDDVTFSLFFIHLFIEQRRKRIVIMLIRKYSIFQIESIYLLKDYRLRLNFYYH